MPRVKHGDTHLSLSTVGLNSPSPLLPVHNWEPCGWDVYGVARPGSGQCPVFPAARSGLCSTGSHCDTGPFLSFPGTNPSSLLLPFPLLVRMAAQQERVPISPPPPSPCAAVCKTNPFLLPLFSSLSSPNRLLSPLPLPPPPPPSARRPPPGPGARGLAHAPGLVGTVVSCSCCHI